MASPRGRVHARAVNRREALAAAADLIADALPAVVRREDGSWQHVVGVTVDDVPCLHIKCIAIGRTRDEEKIKLQPRIAGIATEEIPIFHDPPGQPEPLLDEPVLARGGGGGYRWVRDRDALRSEIARAAGARWAEWRTAASEVFGRDPERWAEACERVAALEDPLGWMAIGAEQRASDLSGLALPVTEAWYGGHWTAAWIGFGPVLERVVRCDASTAGRIANAAAMVRASEHAAGRA